MLLMKFLPVIYFLNLWVRIKTQLITMEKVKEGNSLLYWHPQLKISRQVDFKISELLFKIRRPLNSRPWQSNLFKGANISYTTTNLNDSIVNKAVTKLS